MLKSEENMGELGIKIIKLHQWMEFSMDFSLIFLGKTLGEPWENPMFGGFLRSVHHEMSQRDGNLGKVFIIFYPWMEISSGILPSNWTTSNK